MSEQLSFTNPKVQRLRRLLGRRSFRYDERRFVLEGATSISSALDNGLEIESEFVASDAHPIADVATYRLAADTLARVSDMKTPQPNLAIAVMPSGHGALQHASSVVVCDGINDPGNLGTIMRSAEAAGFDALVVTPGSVDPFHPKVVRASAGAIGALPIESATIADIGAAGLRTIGTSSHRGENYRELSWAGRFAIVMGSEAHGLTRSAAIDTWARIEHHGRSESLNVAMAATLLVFEAMYRRGSSAAV